MNWHLFFEGDDYYASLRADIAAAKSFIGIESYIFEDDEIGLEIMEALLRRAAQGLTVRIIADGVGSYAFPEESLFRMREGGIEFEIFRPVHFYSVFLPSNYRRSHRKLVVIDDRICYAGGMNISRNHSRRAVGHECWRDSMIRIEGPPARDAMASFARMWRKVSRRRLFFSRPGRGLDSVRIIENTPRYRRIFRRIYRTSLLSARYKLWIESAYFIPTLAVLRRLHNRARAGVDVRLLVSEKSDVAMARYASRAVYASLLKHGVRIFEIRGRFLHSKTLIVDDSMAIVGSANLDHRSFLHDLELSMVLRRPDINHALSNQFQLDVQDAREIHADEWADRPFAQKVMEKFCYLFRYYL
jgi:cardiolipin synthase